MGFWLVGMRGRWMDGSVVWTLGAHDCATLNKWMMEGGNEIPLPYN